MRGIVHWKTAKPGRAYHITWYDFCAQGHFTSRLKKLNWNNSEPPALISADFWNGVTIMGEFWHCTIEEVNERG